MDFAKLDVTDKSNEGVWMTIRDYEGDDTDAKLKLVGVDSKVYKKRMHRLMDISRKKKNGLKAAELEKEMLETYAACIVDTENVFDNKKEIKADNYQELLDFLEKYRFIIDQASEFVTERSNFLSS